MVYIFKTNKIKLVSKDNLIFIVCISKYINLFKRINYKMANTHNSKLIFFQWNSILQKTNRYRFKNKEIKYIFWSHNYLELLFQSSKATKRRGKILITIYNYIIFFKFKGWLVHIAHLSHIWSPVATDMFLNRLW